MNYLPMLAKLGTKKDLTKKDFIFEPKFDGTRAICYKNGETKFINRRGVNITSRYPEFNFVKNIKAHTCVLDGEIIVYNKKRNPKFNLLQRREHLKDINLIEERSRLFPATYVVFDILEKEGKDLTSLPLYERKKILDKIIIPSINIEKTDYSLNGKILWNQLIKKRFEGIMAKDKNSKYSVGKRKKDWLKIKFLKTIDTIIIGYTSGKRDISALLTAVYDKDKLRFTGKVGTGFSEKFLKELKIKLERIRINTPQVSTSLKNVKWVEPKLVGEIRFLELTKAKIMRAPSFLRLRMDRLPKSCILKQF